MWLSGGRAPSQMGFSIKANQSQVSFLTPHPVLRGPCGLSEVASLLYRGSMWLCQVSFLPGGAPRPSLRTLGASASDFVPLWMLQAPETPIFPWAISREGAFSELLCMWLYNLYNRCLLFQRGTYSFIHSSQLFMNSVVWQTDTSPDSGLQQWRKSSWPWWQRLDCLSPFFWYWNSKKILFERLISTFATTLQNKSFNL